MKNGEKKPEVQFRLHPRYASIEEQALTFGYYLSNPEWYEEVRSAINWLVELGFFKETDRSYYRLFNEFNVMANNNMETLAHLHKTSDKHIVDTTRTPYKELMNRSEEERKQREEEVRIKQLQKVEDLKNKSEEYNDTISEMTPSEVSNMGLEIRLAKKSYKRK